MAVFYRVRRLGQGAAHRIGVSRYYGSLEFAGPGIGSPENRGKTPWCPLQKAGATGDAGFVAVTNITYGIKDPYAEQS